MIGFAHEREREKDSTWLGREEKKPKKLEEGRRTGDSSFPQSFRLKKKKNPKPRFLVLLLEYSNLKYLNLLIPFFFCCFLSLHMKLWW